MATIMMTDNGKPGTPLQCHFPEDCNAPEVTFLCRNYELLEALHMAYYGLRALCEVLECECLDISEDAVSDFAALGIALERYVQSADYACAMQKIADQSKTKAKGVQDVVSHGIYGFLYLACTDMDEFDYNVYLYDAGMGYLHKSNYGLKNACVGLDLILKSYLIEEIDPIAILRCQAYYLDACRGLSREEDGKA